MWTQSKQFNELNKIITTDQWFCYSVLLVKTEGHAVTARESAVYQLLADNEPCYQTVPGPALPAGWQCHGDARGIGSRGGSSPSVALPHPGCDADVPHTRSFMRCNICLGSQHAAVDWLLLYIYICYAHRKKCGLFSSLIHRNSNQFCSLDPFLFWSL